MVHENSYRSRGKHCFGLRRPPLALGVSLNSDGGSVAKELRSGTSDMKETPR